MVQVQDLCLLEVVQQPVLHMVHTSPLIVAGTLFITGMLTAAAEHMMLYKNTTQQAVDMFHQPPVTTICTEPMVLNHTPPVMELLSISIKATVIMLVLTVAQ